MNYSVFYKIINIIIALVWLINGLYCKILNQVPRHEIIVATILNTEHSRILTLIIGFLEVCIGIWILTRYKQKLNATIQIIIVLIMNIIEFSIASELLLWQKYNIIFAIMFVVTVYISSFHFYKKEDYDI